MNNLNIQSYWEEIKKTLDPIQKQAGNLGYYVFQTQYKFKPDLLLVGINPGGDYDGGASFLERDTNWYTDCKKDPDASCDFNETICTLFGYGTNEKLWQLLENAVGMNTIFFNTGSVEKLKNLSVAKSIESACVKFTRVLVDTYIQPKQIVAMGIDPFNCLKNKPVEMLKLGAVQVKKSYRGDIPIYYIPNPSRITQHLYANGKMEQYRQILEKELC
ncbi:hypothetical protein FACS1894199_03100 [Bacteroidia bacterium]|nr:hypothetical protein FACS1894199_03100 [Bacteroidia bacterium]